MTSDVIVRRGDKLDVPFLRSLLGFAYNWHVNVFDTDVSLSRYVDAWGRKGDTALIAMDGGHSVGAGWFRLFPDTLRGYGYIDEQTPEITIVVVPTRQHEGIGTKLATALLARAKADGYRALSVSVERGDRDEGHFLGLGFEQVREDGKTLTLRRAL